MGRFLFFAIKNKPIIDCIGRIKSCYENNFIPSETTLTLIGMSNKHKLAQAKRTQTIGVTNKSLILGCSKPASQAYSQSNVFPKQNKEERQKILVL